MDIIAPMKNVVITVGRRNDCREKQSLQSLKKLNGTIEFYKNRIVELNLNLEYSKGDLLRLRHPDFESKSNSDNKGIIFLKVRICGKCGFDKKMQLFLHYHKNRTFLLNFNVVFNPKVRNQIMCIFVFR